MDSSEYTSGFFVPAASQLVAPPSPRDEGNAEQAPRAVRTNAPAGLDLWGRFPQGVAILPDQSSNWRTNQCGLVFVWLGIAIAPQNSDISWIYHQP
jgi:hypothetical protein